MSDIQRQLSSHVGRISSVHAAPQQICYLMKLMRGRSGELDPLYFQNLIDTLVDMILGESIMSFYFFDGSESAFIKLKTPITSAANGYFCTGNIQLERDDNDPASRHCVFSLLRLRSGDLRGVELYVENHALIYRTLKGQTDTYLTIPKIELKEYTWHSISVSHFDKELIVRVDESSYKGECAAVSSLAQSFDTATLGASVLPPKMQPKWHFLGEMSTFNFYSSTPMLKASTFRAGSFVETLCVTYKSPCAGAAEEKRRSEALENALFMTIDPKVYIYDVTRVVPFVQQQHGEGESASVFEQVQPD